MTNFLIHQSFCLKNIKFCEKCMQPYNINQEKEHFKLNHDFSVCKCGERVENYNFESHQQKTCRKRQRECIYCHLSLDSDKIEPHIEFCGSRTELCPECKNYIQLKQIVNHKNTKCLFPQKPASRQYVPNQQLDNLYLNQLVRESSTISMSLLPCEFCGECFASYELLNHQNVCDLNPALETIIEGLS